jgi:hypothetical protein
MNGAIVFIVSAFSMSAGGSASSILDFQFSGNSVSGSVLIDDSVADSNSDPQKGLYHNAIAGYFIAVNGARNEFGQQVFTTLQGSSGDVVVGLEADGIGACGLTVDCLGFVLGAKFLEEGPTDYGLGFDYPAHSFPSDAIPNDVPSSGEGILGSVVQQFFLGSAASTSVSAIPEPPGVVQMALGFLVVFIRRLATRQSAKRFGAELKADRSVICY